MRNRTIKGVTFLTIQKFSVCAIYIVKNNTILEHACYNAQIMAYILSHL